MSFGAAAGVRAFDKKLVIGPELWGSTVVTKGQAFSEDGTPLEFLVGGHYTSGPLRVGAGGGLGITRGFGTPVARWVASIEYTPGIEEKKEPKDSDGDGIVDEADACPQVKGVRTNDPLTNGCPPKPPPPPPDKDGDGVPDATDACVDVPGPQRDDPKMNGCPDKDADGVPDPLDKCPDEPGVKTDDPNTNGCPLDTDKDGVYDKDDACKDVPGVKTQDPKTNGCPPDPDRDKDGVLNDVDACPDQPGKPDPDPKKNGCPKVFVQGQQIRILDQVKFAPASAVIVQDKDTLAVLNGVLKVLQDNPDIKKLRVEGHTDNQGGAAYNKTLSGQRAAAVVKWLTAKGIDAGRLKSEGFGMEKPMEDNKTDAGRKANRRVEFHIEEQANKP
jgi:OOP family OmpA-OmpF porin